MFEDQREIRWARYMEALWDAALLMRGAEPSGGGFAREGTEFLELWLTVSPQMAVRYEFQLPLPESGLGRPWTDPLEDDPDEWARRVTGWLQHLVDERFPTWATYADGGFVRRVFLGADGLLEA